MQATSAPTFATGTPGDPPRAAGERGALAWLDASHGELRRQLAALELPAGTLGVVLAPPRSQLVAAGLALQLHLRLASELAGAAAPLAGLAGASALALDAAAWLPGLEALQESLESLLALRAGDARLHARIAALRQLADQRFAAEAAVLAPRLSDNDADPDAPGQRLQARRREMLAELGLDTDA